MIVPRVRRLPRSTNDNIFDATFGFGGLPDIADYPLRLPAGHQSEIGRHFPETTSRDCICSCLLIRNGIAVSMEHIGKANRG